IQEDPKRMTKQRLLKVKQSRHHQTTLPSTSSELKFKIESMGNHPVDDHDLEMCPARIRPSWPKQITPWWLATGPNDKPPFSYATLIAHAIFSSKNGRMTLNDIYLWISKKYPTFRIGAGGWQNSIRHNLSLNKKWFYKIDRQPTQKNPGKGCYWTLVAGTEQLFIDNLTHESSYSRKHHDIAFTAELFLGRSKSDIEHKHASVSSQTTKNDDTPTKLSAARTPRPLMSPLYTTFRTSKKTRTPKRRRSENSDMLDDSDNDSGVDVSNKFIDKKHPRKRRCTNDRSKTCSSSASPTQTLQQFNSSMIYDAPTTATSDIGNLNNLVINNWMEESLLSSENFMCHTNSNYQPEWSPMTENADMWCDPTIAPNCTKRGPITIDLENEESTLIYHHYEENYLPYYDFTTDDLYNYSLYPKTFSPSISIDTNTVPLSYPTIPLYSNYQLQQFVSMQDILYL
ncbi:hypothetical protein INT47_011591, partial [Mucor saturninus]